MFSGPRVPARVVVNADDEFTYDHSIRKRDCTPVAFEFAVNHKPRHQAFVNGADIANRVPHKIFTSLNFNLFLDSSHTRFHLANQCIERTPSDTSRPTAEETFK